MTVSCTAASGITVLASPSAAGTQIAVTPSGVGLYLSALPVTSGAPLSIPVTCSPVADDASTGYLRSDVFTATVLVQGIYAPPPSGTPGSLAVRVPVTLVFQGQPSAVVIDGVRALVAAQTAAQLSAQGIAPSAVSVEQTTGGARRSLRVVSDARGGGHAKRRCCLSRISHNCFPCTVTATP